MVLIFGDFIELEWDKQWRHFLWDFMEMKNEDLIGTEYISWEVTNQQYDKLRPCLGISYNHI